MADKGGDGHITVAERRMIEIAQTARACSMLILAEGYKRGLIKQLDGEDWTFNKASRSLNRYLQTERHALLGLGLERRKKVKNLADLLADEELYDDAPADTDDDDGEGADDPSESD